jgi:hypothetical protein
MKITQLSGYKPVSYGGNMRNSKRFLYLQPTVQKYTILGSLELRGESSFQQPLYLRK